MDTARELPKQCIYMSFCIFAEKDINPGLYSYIFCAHKESLNVPNIVRTAMNVHFNTHFSQNKFVYTL